VFCLPSIVSPSIIIVDKGLKMPSLFVLTTHLKAGV